MRYFLGIDTGATKSHALIADENGRALSFAQGGPGNWEGVGWQSTRDVLEKIIIQAAESADIELVQISAAGFGLAGYDWPEDRQPHVEIIQSLLGSGIPFELVNDAFIGLLAGSKQGWGVAVGAGTSCNCYGRDQQGKIGRAAGFGSWFGEYAGAGELVSQAVRVIADAWAKRGPETVLTDTFIKLTGAKDATDLLAGLTRGRYQLSAAAAPQVFATAAAGDMVANDLIRWAGQGLGNLALGVIRQLQIQDKSFAVILSGSFYHGSPLIQEAMEEVVQREAPGARLIRLQADPVIGGVILGMEQVGLETTTVRPALIESFNTLLVE